MRIAHVTATFPPYYAGTGNVCYHNARLLAERGHEVTVYTARIGRESVESSSGFQVRRLPSLFRMGNAPFTPSLLAIPYYDLVHLHHPFIFGGDLIWLNSLLRRQPYILTYHNDLLWEKGLKSVLFTLYQAINTRFILRKALRVIVTNSDFAASSPILRNLDLMPGGMAEVPNGVDSDLFHYDIDGRGVREEYSIGQKDWVVLFAGALDTTHYLKSGVTNLLEALARFRGRSVVLMVVGGGDRVSAYAALAHRLGIVEQIRFTGWVPHERMGYFYAAADMIVQPSVSFEPFGLVLIEAMACGKPVIASNLPGVRTVVSDGEDGLLTMPGDVTDLAVKIQMLLDSPQRRRTMGQRGRMKAEEKYTWPKVVERLERVYVEALRTENVRSLPVAGLK